MQGNKRARDENIRYVDEIGSSAADKQCRSRATKVQMNLLKGSLAETGLSGFTWKKLVSTPEDVGHDGEKLPPVRDLINTVNMLVLASLLNNCFHTYHGLYTFCTMCICTILFAPCPFSPFYTHDLYKFCTMCSMQPISKALDYISGKQVQLMSRDRLSVEEWRRKLKTYVRRITQTTPSTGGTSATLQSGISS
jgi:hypothetical protein